MQWLRGWHPVLRAETSRQRVWFLNSVLKLDFGIRSMNKQCSVTAVCCSKASRRFVLTIRSLYVPIGKVISSIDKTSVCDRVCGNQLNYFVEVAVVVDESYSAHFCKVVSSEPAIARYLSGTLQLRSEQFSFWDRNCISCRPPDSWLVYSCLAQPPQNGFPSRDQVRC